MSKLNAGSSKKGHQFKLGVQWQVTGIVVGVVIIFIAFILGYILPQMENSLYAQKQMMTQYQCDTVWTMLNYYHEQEASGALSRADAQKSAKAAVSAIRYGDDDTDYFFIIDTKGFMLVNDLSKQLIDTDTSGLKDPNGKFFIQEMLQVAKEKEEGLVSYMWKYKTDEKRIVPKTSYVKSYEPWGWVVGTGIYTVDVQEEIGGLRNTLTIIALIIMLISMGIAIFMTRAMITQPLKNLVAVGKKVAVGDVDHDIHVNSTNEVGQVTQAFADVVSYLKEMASAADKISEGNLSIEIQAKSEKDALSKAFSNMASTLNSLMGEVATLTKAGTEGQLQVRGDVSKFKGDYAAIVQGINDTLGAVIGPLNMAAEYVDSIARGATPDKITDEYKGDFNKIKNNLNKCIDALSTLVEQTGIVIEAAKEGKLDVRSDIDKADGVYKKILRGFNETLDLIVIPINESRGVLAREADYDLTTHVAGDYYGELAQLKNAINSSLDNRINVVLKLREVSNSLSEASNQLTLAAEQSGQATQQIADSSQQVAKGAADQAGGLQETLKALEALSQTIDQIANGAQEQASLIEKNVQVVSQVSTAITQISNNAQQATDGARVAAQAAEKGANMSRETVKGMENIKKTIDVASSKVHGLGDRSKEIGKIVAAIDDIADQTNLLALNAAVEAARAGEQGRGFAVVADEVRKLAERSQAATKEIADLIGGIQSGVEDTITAMEKGTREVDSGYELATKAGQSLDEIMDKSKDMGVQVEQISSAAQQLTAMSTEMVKLSDNVSAIVEQNTAATEEMAATAREVSKSVEGVAGVAEQNSAASEQVSAAAEEISAQVQQVVASGSSLNAMATDFTALVAKYKLNGNGHSKESTADLKVAVKNN